MLRRVCTFERQLVFSSPFPLFPYLHIGGEKKPKLIRLSDMLKRANESKVVVGEESQAMQVIRHQVIRNQATVETTGIIAHCSVQLCHLWKPRKLFVLQKREFWVLLQCILLSSNVSQTGSVLKNSANQQEENKADLWEFGHLLATQHPADTQSHIMPIKCCQDMSILWLVKAQQRETKPYTDTSGQCLRGSFLWLASLNSQGLLLLAFGAQPLSPRQLFLALWKASQWMQRLHLLQALWKLLLACLLQGFCLLLVPVQGQSKGFCLFFENQLHQKTNKARLIPIITSPTALFSINPVAEIST